MLTKICLACKVEKPVSSFHKAKKEKDGFQYSCIDCSKKYHATRYVLQKEKIKTQAANYRIANKDKLQEAQLLWKQKNPQKVKKYQRTTNLRKFGLSYEDYEQMHKQQKGLCAICNNPETFVHSKTKEPASLAVDHCHTTGKTRKLLCKNCNTGLGSFKDNQDVLLKAMQYLKDHNV
jgi:hypothetical protein